MPETFENWLVVSDIDGTLKDKKHKIPQRNYDAIKKFTELGGNFTLASGRLQSSLGRNYNRITPNQPAIVLNGAGLYDYEKEKMICFDVVVDFSAKNRKEIFQDIVVKIQEKYPDYQICPVLDADVTDF